MHALSLGFSLPTVLDGQDFNSPISLLEFDVVLINWASLFQQIHNVKVTQHTGKEYLDCKNWRTIRNKILRRNASITEFLEHGRILIIFVTPLNCISQFLNEQSHFEDTKLYSMIPQPLREVTEAQGTKVAIAKETPKEFITFINSIKNIVNYSATLPANSGIPLMNIEGTKKVICTWQPNDNGGGIIYCPYLIPNYENYKIFIGALAVLYEQLKKNKQPEFPPLPEWHANYKLPEEVKQCAKIEKVKIEQEELRSTLLIAESELEKSIFLKRLFTDQGDSLLEAAARALKLLQYVVSPGPEGRDDLILEGLNGCKIVVEVKGRDNKGAAEGDCAQLEKWVSRFYEEQNVEPKGILIINAYRTTPLNERKEPVFPHQMLDYAGRKVHCLMSGHQLLAHVLAVQQGKMSAEEAQNTISTTIGICQSYSNTADCIALLGQP